MICKLKLLLSIIQIPGQSNLLTIIQFKLHQTMAERSMSMKPL